MKSRFFYPTNNRFLRFYGDAMIALGTWITTKGMRYGGMYEVEFDEDDV
jgi:hypothetical protein